MRSIVLFLAVLPAMVMASEPPPPPEGGIHFVIWGECVDQTTGQEGYCYTGYGVDESVYTTFWQDDEMMFIRKTEKGSTDYEEVWTNPKYNSY